MKKKSKKFPRKQFMESLINLGTYLLSDESDLFRMKLCHNALQCVEGNQMYQLEGHLWWK